MKSNVVKFPDIKYIKENELSTDEEINGFVEAHISPLIVNLIQKGVAVDSSTMEEFSVAHSIMIAVVCKALDKPHPLQEVVEQILENLREELEEDDIN